MGTGATFKPLHGWREFIGEVGIVFLGVIIALGAQQLVEQFDWIEKRKAVEGAIKAELADDDGVMAGLIVMRSRCTQEMLSDSLDAVNRGDRAALGTALERLPIKDLTFDEFAWQAARQSEALMHAGKDTTLQWSQPYVFVAILDRSYQAYLTQYAKVRAVAYGAGPMTETERALALQAISEAVALNLRVQRGAAAFLTSIRELGLRENRTDLRALMKQEQQANPACLIDPATVDLDTLRTPGASLLSRAAR